MEAKKINLFPRSSGRGLIEAVLADRFPFPVPQISAIIWSRPH